MNKIKQLVFLLVSLCSIGPILLLFQLMGFKINLTSSMPIGIYQKQQSKKIHRGDLLSFCLPESIALISKSHDYLGSGSCPGNTIPLLKQVIAIPGDQIELTSSFIWVNRTRYFTPQQSIDHQGRHVHHWVKNGIYHLQNTVWVYGSHDPIHSWDSRYYAGIPLKNIRGIYKPLWTFK